MRQADDGVVMRPEHQTRFFADLHETMQNQFFDGASVAYEEAGDDHIEISLPPADMLIEDMTLKFMGDCFRVVMLLPAMVVGSGEDRRRKIQFDYIPPPL